MPGTPGCVQSLMGSCGRGNFSTGVNAKEANFQLDLKKDLEIKCFCGSCTTFKEHCRASLVAPLVKNPLANARYVGSIQLWEDPTCCVPQLLSLCSSAQDPQLLNSVCPRARALQPEKHHSQKPAACSEE